ncbi:phosphatase PAP2 family protein [Roseibium sediminicola]|uniref:Phosphatase PAP2 family protein n=1 Tax=Roseibium sediminicola TaxID=2933272 RepID=A0ABT0GSJ8_9HYPH|nr:phosphatase PAP2 family protein [Roseibium sp. CAU 1639]MCK7612407.1 phosphatase PAP2 family protein [Roseibium sp. CAU 1639]
MQKHFIKALNCILAANPFFFSCSAFDMTISTRFSFGKESSAFSPVSPPIAANLPGHGQRRQLAFPGTLNWFLFSAVALTTFCLGAFLRVSIPLVSTLPYVLIVLTCLLLEAYVGLRSSFSAIQRERLQLLLKGVVFIFLALATLRVFNHLTMSLALPLADPILDAWDKSLGLDWLGYFGFVQSHPVLAMILKIAYVAFDGASLLGFIALIFMGRTARARYFCEIFLITATLSTAIALFFPALAAVAHHFGPIDQIAGFGKAPGVYHLKQLMALREAEFPSINLVSAAGLATFPSFHTAGGILLIAGFFRTPLSGLVTSFSLVMIASVPVFGGHYFVDVIAGTALAVTVSILIACRPCYKGLFGADPAHH